MSRSIIRETVAASGFSSEIGISPESFGSAEGLTQKEPDKYSDRLFKYIPGEVIVLYISLNNIILSQSKSNVSLLWFSLSFCLVGTGFYLLRMQQRAIKSGAKIDAIRWDDICISMIAFLIWAFTLGGPFVMLPGYANWGAILGALALPLFTFAAPLVKL